MFDHPGPFLLVLLLGVEIATLVFVFIKFRKIERSQRRVVGILLRNGLDVRPSDHPDVASK